MARVPNFLVRSFFEPLWDVYEGSVRLKTLRSLRRTAGRGVPSRADPLAPGGGVCRRVKRCIAVSDGG